MSIPALDTTIGGAAANSYVTLQNAEDYFDAQLGSEKWTDANSDDKTRALLMGAKRLQRETWLGGKVASTQRLAWPRLNVKKIDGIHPDFTWGYGYAGFCDEYYANNEIPQQVKDAQCEFALIFLSSGGGS